MPRFKQLLKLWDYQLPGELIAQKPAQPRDSARLLIYTRQHSPSPKPGEGKGRGLHASFDTFKNLGRHLPKNSVLVFNQTRVIPARLKVQKVTGGLAEILYISHDTKLVKVLSNRPLKPGAVIKITRSKAAQSFTVERRENQFYFLKPSFALAKTLNIFGQYGQTPLPPYIKHSPLSEKQKRAQYQTVFAKTGVSVAAPTASLHFTNSLINKLKRQGIAIKFVRLDVGLGTFSPLTENHMDTGKLHQEFFYIDSATAKYLNNAKRQGRPIIAVGTTVVRTLESAARDGQIKNLFGHTELFIRPGFNFQIINGLITNFHVPQSSLLMLVSTLVGKQTLFKLYQQAIAKNFRFFSFGDGMLIL